MDAADLKTKAVNGIIWTFIEKFIRYFIQFVFGIILARLLSPDDFGIIGMLAIFIALAQIFTDCGFTSAIIQKQNCTEEDLCTAFFFNNIVAIVLYCTLFVSAPFIASFYQTPILTNVTRIASISIMLSALSAVQNAQLTKALRFKEQSIISIFSILFAGLASVALAYHGYGVWALVFQAIINQALLAFGFWATSKWIPKLSFSKKSFSQLWSFGSKILGSSLINAIYTNIYALFIGKKFSPQDVGYFNCGDQYARLPAQTIQDVIIKVNYPILSKIQNENEKLLHAYKKLLRFPQFVLCPILVGTTVLAKPIIELILGEKWLPCVTIFQIICLSSFFTPLTHINLNLLYVKNRTDLVLKLELIKKTIAFIILLSLLPLGIIPMVIGKAAYEFIAFSFNCYFTYRILGYGLFQQIREILPIVINSSIMGGFVYFSTLHFSSALLIVLTGFFGGGLFYIFLEIITKEKSFLEFKLFLSNQIKMQRTSKENQHD